jgi:F0F1-type ATP synthase assembly protein I
MALTPINPRAAGMKYSTIGLEFALSIVAGWWLGRWLDGKLDMAPYLEATGFILGLITAFRSLMRAAKQMQREAEEEVEKAALRGATPDEADKHGS